MRNGSRLKQSIDALLAAAVANGNVPGVIAAVTTATGTIYEGAAGVRTQGQGAPMGQDTVVWLASMTKPIIGAAAMQLVEQGRIALDDPCAKVIPEFADFKVLTGWSAQGEALTRPSKIPVTLRHLLTHTSGLVYDTWNPDMARYQKLHSIPRASSGLERGLRVPLAFDPGARWEYGINIEWTGKLIEAVSGQRLGHYLIDHLTGPLGMTSTGFKITPDMRARLAKVHQRSAEGGVTVTDLEINQNPEFEPGGGGLYSTASDYLRFMRMILNGGRGDGDAGANGAGGATRGNQVLRPDTVALMSQNAMGALRVRMLPTQAPALSLDAEFFPGTPKTWGLSFMINQETAPTGRSPGSLAWAGLANTFFWIDPVQKIGGLILMQVLPFVDQQALGVFTRFETGVYEGLGPS